MSTQTTVTPQLSFSENMSLFFTRQVNGKSISERKSLLYRLVEEMSDFEASGDRTILFAGDEHTQIGYIKCLMHSIPKTSHS
uniref:hypothetical protein n=1 Tax=Streptococcus pluranimalium TaxID=82348 RepID=UPI003F68C135